MPTDLAPYQDQALSRRDRQEVALVQAAQLPARVANARVNAAAFLAHSGMINAGVLTGVEAELVRTHGPAMEMRAMSIVDTYCALVNSELLRLGLAE